MADNGDNFLKGFAFGAILGGVLGVLFAPKSGRETREELSTESEKLISQLKSDIENAKKAALQSFEQGKDRIVEKLSQDETEESTVGEDKEKTEAKKRTRRRRPPRSKSTKSDNK